MVRLFAVLAIAVGLAASAQTPPSGRDVPRTHINFTEPDLIDGKVDKPDIEIIEVTIRRRHQTIIRIPMDFNRKVIASVAEI